tara:strand:- start:457 stop:609 length:153 start_codon:yes stop_codon:yes gene_type:complete
MVHHLAPEVMVLLLLDIKHNKTQEVALPPDFMKLVVQTAVFWPHPKTNNN